VPPGMRLTMLALDTRQAAPPAPPQPPPGPPAAPPGSPCSGPLLQAAGALGARGAPAHLRNQRPSNAWRCARQRRMLVMMYSMQAHRQQAHTRQSHGNACSECILPGAAGKALARAAAARATDGTGADMQLTKARSRAPADGVMVRRRRNGGRRARRREAAARVRL
jgi:hypothetical protein